MHSLPTATCNVDLTDCLYCVCVAKACLDVQVKALCDGAVETLGRVRYDGKVKHPFTAHPKVDPETGECFWLCCLHSTHVFITQM